VAALQQPRLGLSKVTQQVGTCHVIVQPCLDPWLEGGSFCTNADGYQHTAIPKRSFKPETTPLWTEIWDTAAETPRFVADCTTWQGMDEPLSGAIAVW